MADALADRNQPRACCAGACIVETHTTVAATVIREAALLVVPDALVAIVFAGWVVAPEGTGILGKNASDKSVDEEDALITPHVYSVVDLLGLPRPKAGI